RGILQAALNLVDFIDLEVDDHIQVASDKRRVRRLRVREDADHKLLNFWRTQNVVRVRDKSQRRAVLPFLEHERAAEDGRVVVLVGLLKRLVFLVDRFVNVLGQDVQVSNAENVFWIL